MGAIHKMGVIASLLLMVHATLCAIQHRSYLKSTQESFTTPPFEIIIQCLVATLGGIWGVLGLKGGMVPIRTTEALSKQTMDALLPGLDFMHFNTRELR